MGKSEEDFFRDTNLKKYKFGNRMKKYLERKSQRNCILERKNSKIFACGALKRKETITIIR